MMDEPAQLQEEDSIESALRRDLARGELVPAVIAPVLRHLLANDDHGLFGDDVLARLRGMLADLAAQLLTAIDRAAGRPAPVAPTDARLPELIAEMAGMAHLLPHLHALALEWQMTERLETQLGVDAVISPLLQALIGSSEPETGAAAMRLLAAQTRFCQHQRRMQLPLEELPAEVLHSLLGAVPDLMDGAPLADVAVGLVRARYDETTSRLGLIARLVNDMGAAAMAALALGHAGVAIFASALAAERGVKREAVLLAMQEGQRTRLGLMLRAAGVRNGQVEEVLLALHPDHPVPLGLGRLGPEQASALLGDAPLVGEG